MFLFPFMVNAAPANSAECEADAGGFTELELDLNGGAANISASPDGTAVVPEGYSTIYVLTYGEELIIQNVGAEPSFIVRPQGLYTIHTLVYDPETLDLGIVVIGETTGFDVNALLIQGGGNICAALDVTGAKFRFSGVNPDCNEVEGGTVAMPNGETMRYTCPGDDMPDIVQFESMNTAGSYQYVITDDENIILALPEGDMADFDGAGEGICRVWGLAYSGNIIAEVGDNAAKVALSDECYDLSDNFITVIREVPEGGTVALKNGGTQRFTCPGDGQSDIVRFFSENTAGLYRYVITDENNVILGLPEGDMADFEEAGEGICRVWGLAYTGNIIAEVGDNAAEVALSDDCYDLSDNYITIIRNCELPCRAKAGRMKPLNEPCLADGTATLLAGERRRGNVPDGFSVIFVLTKGEDLVIQAVNEEPEFTVEEAGDYRIHRLVYNPESLDLSIVEPGVTTGADILALLIQGGGEICAALDVRGAYFNVEACPECTADAGALQPIFEPCFIFGSAFLLARFTETPVVPSGFEVLFVLTSGEGLVIQQVNDVPVFEVAESGLYTIHTLVYDPETLDLSVIVPGVTTGFDVNALLIQGGGSICGALDVAGAVFTPEGNCPFTLAVYPNPTAGTLTVDLSELQELPYRELGALQLQLVNMNGEVIVNQELMHGEQQREFNLEGLANGVYLVRILEDGEVVETTKVTKVE